MKPILNAMTIDEAFDDVLQGDEVNLTSFILHDELNEDFWVKGKLDPAIRERLLQIGMDFYESLKIDEMFGPIDTKAFLKDMLFLGSLASFNYSKYADVDLHLLVDLGAICADEKAKQLLAAYFQKCKTEWNTYHSNLRVKGYDVEVYVEDIHNSNAANGVYSLFQDKWIRKPREMHPSYCAEYVKQKAKKYIEQIDFLDSCVDSSLDKRRLNKVLRITELLIDKIMTMRKESLNRKDSDEMGDGNIIYKVLRRTGHMDKLWSILNKVYDKSYSMG